MIYAFLAKGFEEVEAIAAIDVIRRAEIEIATVGIGSKIVCGSHNIPVFCDMDESEINLADDIDGIMASTMEGFSVGCGDAVLGLNPVDDSVENVARILKSFHEFRVKWDIPTQCCVLAHISTQMEAIEKMNAPVDLMFQSIAGSQKGNEAFGITAQLLQDGHDLMMTKGVSTGPNVMYFETGQGSELSADANFGWDQLTMEARCYGLARHYTPFHLEHNYHYNCCTLGVLCDA